MDSNKLKAKIIECGLTYKEMHELLNISRTSFFSKLKGKTQFKLDEVEAIVIILNLSKEDIIKIFFT